MSTAVDPPFLVRDLSTDAEIAAAYPLMAELRPQLPSGEAFVGLVRRQQQDRYVLVGGFAGERLVALAGIRSSHTLSRGPHLFVDDLVTAAAARGRGYGTAMLRALGRRAEEMGLPILCLDSRDTALTFYKQVGFEPHSSVPCKIAVGDLLRASITG
jgi:GNAT superfamily N-acetyltransferase